MHNEAPLLPYFLRHYTSFSDQVVIFDDHSTDGTPDIARTFERVKVQDYPGQGLDDLAFVEFSSQQYRVARGQADWVIWPDADEFVYHPYLLMTLGRYMASGVTLPLTDGYAMLADHFPTGAGQIYDEIKTGVRYGPESKRIVLNPAIDVRWGAGKHFVEFESGAVPSQTAELKLLHYRHLGKDWFNGRNQKNGARISERNIQHNLGWQVMPQNQDRAGWHTQTDMFKDAIQVVP